MRWARMKVQRYVTVVQCLSSVQWNRGAMYWGMSYRCMPSAFEVDGTGAVSMYPLQLAGGKAAALAGWNKQLWARRG